MTDQPMETMFGTALWRQCGAALDMLEKALLACPDSLWTAQLWVVPADSHFPPPFAEFWYVTYHALVWFDLYLTGVPEEAFAPPAPFPHGEIDSRETLPDQPYSREVLHTYFVALRQKCHDQYLHLTGEQMSRTVTYGRTFSYMELQLYNLRHIQEHAAQLSLFLGQHNVPDVDWVARAKE